MDHIKSSRLISSKELDQHFSHSNSTRWRMIQRGDFPAPVKLHGGGRINYWYEHEIEAFKAACANYRIQTTFK